MLVFIGIVLFLGLIALLSHTPKTWEEKEFDSLVKDLERVRKENEL